MMMRSDWRRSTSRSLVLMLSLLLSLGHVCELPVFADVVAHVYGAAHHAPDHHPDENQVACDAIVGVPSSTSGHPNLASTSGPPNLGPSLDAAATPPVIGTVPLRVAAAASQESNGLPRRLPLFLLHASLLI